jgi:hypothetical protein
VLVTVVGFLQRVNNYLEDACYVEGQTLDCKKDFLDCGTSAKLADFSEKHKIWINLSSAFNTCLGAEAIFEYGIYQRIGYVVLTIYQSFISFK